MTDFLQSTRISAIAFRARASGVAAVLAAIWVVGAALLIPGVARASEGSGGAASADSQTREEESETNPDLGDPRGGTDDSDTQSDEEQRDVPRASEAGGDESAADSDRDEPESRRSADDESAQTKGDSTNGDDAALGSGDDSPTREVSDDRQPEEGSPSERDSLRDSIRRRVGERTVGIADRARERSQAARERAREAVDDRLSRRSDDATPSDGNRRPRDPSRDRTTIAVAGDPGEVRLLPGRRDVLVRRRALVRGYVPIGRPGRVVVLEVMRRDGSWAEVDRTRTIEDGKFYLAWYPTRPGYFRVRARPVNPAVGSPSRARLLYIYRTAVASWYGPGFYGNRTACGQTFTNRLLGVAHRSLPCGYRLTVRYGDRAITVRVVDRGPFVPGRDYDLTEATRNYLGFDGVDEIWATA